MVKDAIGNGVTVGDHIYNVVSGQKYRLTKIVVRESYIYDVARRTYVAGVKTIVSGKPVDKSGNSLNRYYTDKQARRVGLSRSIKVAGDFDPDNPVILTNA